MAGLPPAEQLAYKTAFSDALTTTFSYAVPIMAAAFVLAWLLPEEELRSRVHGAPDTGRELSAAAAPGTAEPDATPTAGRA